MSVSDDQVLSKRAEWTKNFPSFKRLFAPKVRLNSFHPTRNPKGIVDLGGAENKLCEDLFIEKFRQPEMNTIEPWMFYYFEYHGMQRFREALANFLSERLDAKQSITPDNIIVTSGVGAALDLLAHALAEPGDTFLSPSPYYSRIRTDMGERSQIDFVDVLLEPSTQFTLTVGKVKKAYEDATSKGKSVQGIILINPHNPTGDIYSKQLITDILNFAKRKELHVVMDEIYALSVFDGDFYSVASLDSLPDPARTHLVWGFSKDFAMSGFRVGVIHSWNSSVVSSIKPLCYFAAVPTIIQDKLCKMISDKEWLDTVYFPTNISRMKTNRNIVVQAVEQIGGVVHPSKGAFFVWADFSQVFEKLEDKPGPYDLFLKLFEAGVYVEPARAFYMDDVYWYRIIFTLPETLLREGLTRMKSVMSHFCGERHSKAAVMDLNIDLGNIESIELVQASGATSIVTVDSANAAAVVSGDSAGDSLESLMRTLWTQLRNTDYIEKHEGQWEKENPEDAAELRDILSGKKEGKSLDDV